jgi:LuxR family maltose regulon positive regulatory protein
LQIAELEVADVATGIWGGWMPQVLLLPRVRLAQARFDEALELLDRLATRAEAHRHGSILIEARALQALAWHGKKNDERALEYLEHALALAAPEGFARPFVVAGEPMDVLLRRAATRGVEPEYVGKLLAVFGASEEQALAARPLAQPLSEAPSKRELEVLRLIAAGLSNQEIAQTLFIAVSTVKSHVKHVYGKLDVKRRTEAVARARELGLL